MPSPSALRLIAAALWIGAGVGYFVVEAAAASRLAGYSVANDYISDLGRPDSPLAWWMNAAFRVQGMAFVVAGALTVHADRPRRGRMVFVVAACVYGAGSVAVGLVPSGGAGAPALVHAAGAAAAIVGGNLAVLAAGRAGLPAGAGGVHAVGYGLGVVGLVGGALLLWSGLPRGLCERAAIYAIIAWQLLAATATVTASAANRGPGPT
ncbi:putative membrane protein [Mycolicibacterium chubuense NBB4]|uniref:Putative membrane protein n=1 Tax=Mycolicibacterium chubuense (strain NBB4) TaxID=710421 RepID=I4BC50_MYCCN|nr:DUF998 domain-containing protein [Mycolicibacterium chubuense]AFM14857.1 putative membrane protein [Mycolicibacterium chubuense NBB4]